MSASPVQLKVAGKTYRVVTSASTDDLEHLVQKVEATLAEVNPGGREVSAQALVLVAITLAHELHEERVCREAVEARHRSVLEALLLKVDGVLTDSEQLVKGEEEGVRHSDARVVSKRASSSKSSHCRTTSSV